MRYRRAASFGLLLVTSMVSALRYHSYTQSLSRVHARAKQRFPSPLKQHIQHKHDIIDSIKAVDEAFRALYVVIQRKGYEDALMQRVVSGSGGVYIAVIFK